MTVTGFPRQATREAIFDRYHAQGLWSAVPLADDFERIAGSGHADFVFVSADDVERSVTFASLWTEANELAARLEAAGLRRGDVMACALPASRTAYLAYYAASVGGFIYAPLLPFLSHRDLIDALARLSAKAILAPVDVGAPLYEALNGAGDQSDQIWLTDSTTSEDWVLALNEIRVSSRSLGRGYAAHPDAPHVVIFTSGSSGRAKAVVHSQNSLRAGLSSIVSRAQIKAGDRYLTIAPLAHMFGLYSLLMPSVAGVDRVVAYSSWSRDRVRHLIAEQAITVVGLPPFLADDLLRGTEPDSVWTRSLRTLVVGGDRTDPELFSLAETLGFTMLGSYSCSEATDLSVFSPNDPLEVRAHNAGRVLDTTETAILSTNEIVEDRGVRGEILVRSPGQMLGYIDAGDDADGVLPSGWIRTGDIGSISPDGVVRLEGRVKDVIIRAGENISAVEVDKRLGTHPGVVDCAVVGIQGRSRTEKICAFVVIDGSCAVDIRTVVAHFEKQGSPPHAIPKEVHICDAIPRTVTGKLQRDELRRMYEELRSRS